MKLVLAFVLVVVTSSMPAAQTPAPTPNASPTTSPAAGSTSMTSILPDLDRLQAVASQVNMEIGRLRIEKWKADAESKRQAQGNADSVQRNLTAALPGMIDAVRSAPQDVNAEFKLYRNLNALYDVMVSLTESTGAFGPKAEYEALASQIQTVDSVRRNLGDALERLTSSTQSELNQLRTQVRTLQQAAAATAAPPKKTVVDDTQPSSKAAHKKKKPAATSGSDSTNTTGASSQPPKS